MRLPPRRRLGIALALLVLAFVAWRAWVSLNPRAADTPIEAPDPAPSAQNPSSPTLHGAPSPLPRAGAAAVDASAAASAAAAGAKTYSFHVVADADGTAVGDATIETQSGTRLGKTDAEGNLSVTFRVPRVVGATRVLVRRVGFVVELVRPRVGETTQVRLMRGLSIRGRVVLEPNDAPVVGARVTLVDSEGLRLADEVTTGADGRFEVDDARPREVFDAEFVVRALGRASMTVPATPGLSSGDLLVRMPEGGTLSGVVRDESGGALPGVPIFLHPATGALHVSTATDSHPWVTVEQTSTDSSGRYEIAGIETKELHVAVALPRPLLVAPSEPFKFERVGDRIERDIRVPVPGTLNVTVDGLPPKGEAVLSLLGAKLQANVTDAERSSPDSWVFVDLAPGGYKVRLTADGYPLGAKAIEVASGRVAHLAFSFRGSLTLKGRVSYSDGRPAVDARVWWKGAASAVTRADETGGFQFGGLDASTGRLVVAPPDGVRGIARSFSDAVRPGGDPLRIVLGSFPRVRFLPAGVPAGTTVSAFVESAVYRGRAPPSVGEDGVLELTVDQVGQPTRITWTAEDREPLVTEVRGLAPGEVLDLGTRTFAEGRTVVLRIVDGADQPVPEARISYISSWAFLRDTVSSDDQGAASLLHAPPFPFLVSVTAEGRAPQLLVVPAGTSGPVVLQLGAEGTLDLRVTDREGTPAANAYVQLLPAEVDAYDPTPEGVPQGALTDAAGALEQRVQARTYRVRVFPATLEGEATVGPLVVRAGETTTFEIRLP